MSGLPLKSNEAIERRTELLDLLVKGLQVTLETGIAANVNTPSKAPSR